MQNGRQIDLSEQVERVKRKTRPWKAIIALLFAIAAAIISDQARHDSAPIFSATSHLAGDWVLLESTVHDPVAQRVRTVNVFISAQETRLYPVELRYAWPSELDLMAWLAGLRLEHRWGGWRREEFTASSPRHISVYKPPSGPKP